ncbi:MAG: hypothetical protein EOP88_06120 [Verrucomicrobiaceae bacterium]|nr:MAG: hypothetical protein EOP88_06120 [Verrucomicrobiaceae bacterium]
MPPKNFQLTFAWMFIATILMGVAVWQAQVTVAQEAAAKHAVLPPPPKTRHAIRSATGFTGNVVEDYIARCGKGMTDQEIQWVLEDFSSAGLKMDWRSSDFPEQSFRQMIARQLRWYLDSVKDGLRLDQAQTEAARTNLTRFFLEQADGFLEKRKDASSGFGPVPDAASANGLDWLSANPWDPALPLHPFMPWTLCDLTPDQERITWKRWFQSLGKKEAVEPGHAHSSNLAELTGEPGFLFSQPGSTDSAGISAPRWAMFPDRILPLLKTQELVDPHYYEDPFAKSLPPVGPTLVGNIRRLHPDQFRLLLLFFPEMAADVEKELQAPSR